MKTLFAGFLTSFFTTLFSCQQKEGQFKSVSVDDFSTLIANPEVQLLDVRTVAEILGRTRAPQYQYQCIG